jgi:4-amino-4-deoxy-L-arabinose transferase-like glycosyltransferase
VSRKRRAGLIGATFIVALTIFLVGLGRPPLFEPDEGRYAEVAREMLVRGDFVTPHNDFVRYFEKPPLVYWTTAASMRIFGRNEFAARLQAAVFSAGEVAVTADLGAAMFDLSVGILSAAALMLSPLFFAFARFATPDPALAFFMTAALALFWRAADPPGFATRGSRNRMLGAAALLALGTLAKGPVALALVGAIALAWLVHQGRARDALRAPWGGCVAVYLALAVPWFALAAYRNPGFLDFFFIHEHIHRYLDNNEHQWGLWFFIPVVLGGAWPWIFFAPFAFRADRQEAPCNNEADEDRNPPVLAKLRLKIASIRLAIAYLSVWFGLIFVFFSIPQSKLGEYILPAFPPVAIMSGLGLTRLARLDRKRRIGILFVLAAIDIALAVTVMVVAVELRRPLIAALGNDAIVASGALAVATMAALAIAWLNRDATTVWPIAGALAVGTLVALGAMAKAREAAAPFTSYRKLARQVSPYLGARCVLASYRHQIQALPFYLGKREVLVGYRGELAPFGDSIDAAPTFIPTDRRLAGEWSSRPCVVVIANRRDLPHLEQLLKPAPKIIGREGKKVALFNGPITPIGQRSSQRPNLIEHFPGRLDD